MTKQTIPTTNTKVIDWVNEIADLTQPDAVCWCDGSEKEIQAINSKRREAIAHGMTMEEAMEKYQ